MSVDSHKKHKKRGALDMEEHKGNAGENCCKKDKNHKKDILIASLFLCVTPCTLWLKSLLWNQDLTGEGSDEVIR